MRTITLIILTIFMLVLVKSLKCHASTYIEIEEIDIVTTQMQTTPTRDPNMDAVQAFVEHSSYSREFTEYVKANHDEIAMLRAQKPFFEQVNRMRNKRPDLWNDVMWCHFDGIGANGDLHDKDVEASDNLKKMSSCTTLMGRSLIQFIAKMFNVLGVLHP